MSSQGMATFLLVEARATKLIFQFIPVQFISVALYTLLVSYILRPYSAKVILQRLVSMSMNPEQKATKVVLMCVS